MILFGGFDETAPEFGMGNLCQLNGLLENAFASKLCGAVLGHDEIRVRSQSRCAAPLPNLQSSSVVNQFRYVMADSLPEAHQAHFQRIFSSFI